MQEIYKTIDLENEKVNRIINSAFEIFVKNDFEKASINNIVKSAYVSKGLIYHYFKDKKELFDFLFAFATKETFYSFNKDFDWDNADFFDRYMMILNDKLEIMKLYPYMIDFFNKYRSHMDTEKIRTEFENNNPGGREKVYRQNIDLDVVKDGVDYKEMVNIVRWTTKGMMQEFIEKHNTSDFNEEMDNFKDNCLEYMTVIKKQFYK